MELNKFNANPIDSEERRWLKFFKDGEQLNDSALPDWMATQEMQQAMNTLSTFSEKERQYHQYQARQEYLREQRSLQLELEQTSRALLEERQEKQAALQRERAAMKDKQAAMKDKQSALQREDAALAEIERLKALLAQKPH